MAVARQRRLPHLTLNLPTTTDRNNFIPPSLPSPSPSFRLSDLERISLLGRGNGGTVYKVFHRPTSTLYALKHLHTPNSLHLRHETTREIDILRRTSSNSSPHVVQLHAVLPLPSGDLSLLLELLSGGSLASISPPFPDLALSAVARHALLGLQSLHALRIVHRDIKPSNLLVSGDGVVKIADFGSGKVLRPSLDPCVSYVGTCAYMSPERMECEGGYDAYAGDVWSLGLAVLELKRGRFPLLKEGERPDWATLMCAICFDELEEVEGESAEFRGFVECCLQRESGRRWTVAELLGHPFVVRGGAEEAQRALREMVVVEPPPSAEW